MLGKFGGGGGGVEGEREGVHQYLQNIQNILTECHH